MYVISRFVLCFQMILVSLSCFDFFLCNLGRKWEYIPCPKMLGFIWRAVSVQSNHVNHFHTYAVLKLPSSILGDYTVARDDRIGLRS